MANSTHITDEVVKKVAHLARLELTPEDVAKFAKQMEAIRVTMDELSEVDTEDVAPTYIVTGQDTELEADELIDFVPQKSDLFTNVDGEMIDGQIVVPAVF